ncbi:histidine kinase N-terminal domain-containing protein [Actinomycetaceae bacterium TAE3-ERU4]|nr:histidine kinase N-terminal domain-containing protein [Actinomycetaceae bacterium TAE3-ERU4]
MQTLSEIIERNNCRDLSDLDIDWLHVLVSDWQILADLASADLILWLPDENEQFVAVAHCRPSTAATVHVEDILGLYLPASRCQELRRVMDTGVSFSPAAPRWAGSYSVDETIVPVTHNGRIIGVVSCESNIGAASSFSSFDHWFTDSAEILMKMIATGEYPYQATPTSAFNGAPRVVDGVVRIDEEGVILGISPNARSCFRRIGIRGQMVGDRLVQAVTERVENGVSTVDEALPLVLMGRAAWRTELELAGATISLRALPLHVNGKRQGAVVLCRDVSEVRRIEREIMSKEATIREIHHRVKNNLATVSALIRLQARRSDNPLIKQALAEAERRVSTISTVHEALSATLETELDYTALARKIASNAAILASSNHLIEVRVEGDFGVVDADCASTLSTVLAELVANSVEHGYSNHGGTIQVLVERRGPYVLVTVRDEGISINPDRIGKGLGTQIVSSLVKAELQGTISWTPRETGGTDAVFSALVDRNARRAAGRA